jgi:hypothetical protein
MDIENDLHISVGQIIFGESRLSLVTFDFHFVRFRNERIGGVHTVPSGPFPGFHAWK